MLKSHYIEDVFIEFIAYCDRQVIQLSHQDLTASTSFNNVLSSGNQLTKNQANFIIKILQKYRMFAKMAGLDYSQALDDPQWKKSFRVLDLSKRAYIEKDEDGSIWVCLKFPFALKEVFEKEISPVVKDYSSSVWDAEERVRKLKFYNFNLVEIFEFLQKHQFTIDDTFMIALAEVEEIWQNSETIIPYCEKHFGATVDLINAPRETVEWFEQHRTCNQSSDLLLAKSMGYPYLEIPQNLVEKIAFSSESNFHLKSLDSFFEIYKAVGGPVAVILNKGDNSVNWVKEFCGTAIESGIDSQEIRVCFRLDKQEDHGFNQWVKDSGYGGKVESGNIFIFQNKPPKWLFSEGKNVKIIVTNSLYPIPSATTQTWMDNHTCVFFVGDIKAAHVKEKKIVEL
jgi:hypothetical protein